MVVHVSPQALLQELRGFAKSEALERFTKLQLFFIVTTTTFSVIIKVIFVIA